MIIYEQVRCQLKIENGFSEHFLSNMKVQQGYPLSSTLFGLCVDKLENLVNRVTREGLDVPKLMTEVILLCLYADDDELFSYNLQVMHRLVS